MKRNQTPAWGSAHECDLTLCRIL